MISLIKAVGNVLPADPKAAIEKLIAVTRELHEVMASEAHAIAVRDEVRMLDMSTRKEKLLLQYESGAREFKARMAEFRGIDKTLLDRLEDEQDHLATITKDNQQLLTMQ